MTNVTFHSKRSRRSSVIVFEITPKKKQENCKIIDSFLIDIRSLSPPLKPEIIDFFIRSWFHIETSIWSVKVDTSKTIPNCRFLSILILLLASFGKPVWNRRYGRKAVWHQWETIISPRIPGCSILHCVLVISSVSKLSNTFFSKTWFIILQLQDALGDGFR